MAATPGARGVILRSAITDPSNYRSAKHLDRWLKARGIIGLSGIDTRALTALIRSKGMPNAVIAHAKDGKFDLHGLKEEAREWPGLEGMDLVPMVTSAQRFTWDETPWALGKGLWPADRARVQRRRHRLRHQAQHPAAARRRRLQDHGGAGDHVGRRHSGDEAGRRVPLQRPRRSRRDRQIRRACDQAGDRFGHADLRHLPRPSDAGPRRRRQDQEDASGPSRRQSSGQGRDHRQGGDHLDEPRLCGGPGRHCRRARRKPTSRCSTAPIAASSSTASRCSRCSITRKPRPARATRITCSSGSRI